MSLFVTFLIFIQFNPVSVSIVTLSRFNFDRDNNWPNKLHDKSNRSIKNEQFSPNVILFIYFHLELNSPPEKFAQLVADCVYIYADCSWF